MPIKSRGGAAAAPTSRDCARASRAGAIAPRLLSEEAAFWPGAVRGGATLDPGRADLTLSAIFVWASWDERGLRGRSLPKASAIASTSSLCAPVECPRLENGSGPMGIKGVVCSLNDRGYRTRSGARRCRDGCHPQGADSGAEECPG